jgi:hypothetical protein
LGRVGDNFLKNASHPVEAPSASSATSLGHNFLFFIVYSFGLLSLLALAACSKDAFFLNTKVLSNLKRDTS